MHICCRVKLGPKMAFFESKLHCRENDILKKNKKKTNITICCVKTWSNYVAQHTWTSFDSTLDQVLTQPFWHFLAFFLLKICWNHDFYSVFSKNLHYLSHPPPKHRNTICEHNCANWKCLFFSAFFVFCCVRFLLLFGRGMKTKNKTQNKTTKKERRPQDANNKTI